MSFVYISLQVVLVAIFALVLRMALKASRGLNPILGWLIGLAFFLIVPLSIMVLNGGFVLPSKFDVGQNWATIDLTSSKLLLPYLVIWTSLFCSCVAIFLFLPLTPLENGGGLTFSRSALQRAILIGMALSVADWVFMIHLVGGIDVFLVSHWYHRNEELVSQYGDLFVLLEHLSLVNQIVFTSCALLYTSLGLKQRDTRWGFTSLIFFFFLLEIGMSGNRIFFACYLLGLITAAWIHGRRRLLIGMIALSPVIIIIFSLWASVRRDLSAIPDSLDTAIQEESGARPMKSIMNAAMDVTEGMDAVLLMHIVSDFGPRVPYLYGLSYSRAITSPVPRFLYPHKPKNFTDFLASVYLPGEETSLNATALGEMYANFGPFTLFLFPALSLGMVFLTNWAAKKQAKHGLLAPLLFVLAIWAARSTVEDGFVILLLAYPLIFAFRLEKGLGSPPLKVHVTTVSPADDYRTSPAGQPSLTPEAD
jgi:hypothetical protein